MFGNIFDTMRISGSALSAERKRMNVIANNLANINTTRGADGKPYQRKYVVFETILNNEVNSNTNLNEHGVKVSEVVTDQRPFIKVYKPGHPDADKDGYLSKPNINMVEENVDLLSASRAYGANLSFLKASKSMAKSMIELLLR